jgi:hypothetical protein
MGRPSRKVKRLCRLRYDQQLSIHPIIVYIAGYSTDFLLMCWCPRRLVDPAGKMFAIAGTFAGSCGLEPSYLETSEADPHQRTGFAFVNARRKTIKLLDDKWLKRKLVPLRPAATGIGATGTAI